SGAASGASAAGTSAAIAPESAVTTGEVPNRADAAKVKTSILKPLKVVALGADYGRGAEAGTRFKSRGDGRQVPRRSCSPRPVARRTHGAPREGAGKGPGLRHCEERSDAAIQTASDAVLDCFASLAMTAF